MYWMIYEEKGETERERRKKKIQMIYKENRKENVRDRERKKE